MHALSQVSALLIRLLFLVLGLFFIAGLIAIASLLLLLWLARALWAGLLGRPVTPWQFALKRQAAWQRSARDRLRRRAQTPPAAEPAWCRAADVSDVEPKNEKQQNQ